MNANNDRGVHEDIQKVLDGDSRAFELIVLRFQKRIYYSVLQIVTRHADADDVIQETFIKAYTNLASYDMNYPFYPWLYRIAINTALNHQKRTSRRRAMSLDDLENSSRHDLGVEPQQVCDMVGAELVLQLKEALNRIPCEQRAVFMLRVNDGLSYQEISDTLEISIGTVMSRLSRAREKLRGMLQNYVRTKGIEV